MGLRSHASAFFVGSEHAGRSEKEGRPFTGSTATGVILRLRNALKNDLKTQPNMNTQAAGLAIIGRPPKRCSSLLETSSEYVMNYL